MRLDSRDLHGPGKAQALRELYGRTVMRVDLWAHDNAPQGTLDFTATVALLGDSLGYARCMHTPAHLLRSRELMQDGSDDVLLGSCSQDCIVRYDGGELAIPGGGFAIMSKARQSESITPWGGMSHGIQVPRAVLARLLPRLEEAPVRVFAPGTPGAAVALGYAALLAANPGLPAAQMHAATSHLHALVAGLLDPAASARLPPEHEAQAAPRLALIQRDIQARLDWPQLSLAHIARLHHLTPRQVQRLFARQGTGFREYVSAARLDRARAQLADPAQRHRRVLEIALDCGFDDVSAFSQAFRRRFGMTPSEARHGG